MFPSCNIDGKRARCRLAGLRRAEFWRKTGWANLKLATARRMALRAEKQQAAQEAVHRAALVGAIENLKQRK